MRRKFRLPVPLLDVRQYFLIDEFPHHLTNHFLLIAEERVDFHVINTMKWKHRKNPQFADCRVIVPTNLRSRGSCSRSSLDD